MIITDEIASADAFMLLLLAVSNHCIFYFFYSCVELEFLFLESKTYRYRADNSFTLREINPLRTHVAHLPFSVNTLPLFRPQDGWETSTVKCCCLDQFLFPISLLADDPQSKP